MPPSEMANLSQPFCKKAKFFPNPFQNFHTIKDCRWSYPSQMTFEAPSQYFVNMGGGGGGILNGIALYFSALN